MHFLRKFSSKSFLTRGVVALSSAAGLGLAWQHSNSADNRSDSYKSALISLPSSFYHPLLWPVWTMDNTASQFIHRSHSQDGFSPHYFSTKGDVPDPESAKGSVVDASNNLPNHSCNCLGRDSIANAAARVGPAVVNLSVPRNLLGRTLGKSIGSGTIINEDGLILTCAHVVVVSQALKSSSKVEVTLQDGRSFEGTVLHADLHSDVAVVSIKSKTPLPTAKLGCSSKLRPGDWVVAMGCPLTLQNTTTAGIVSNVGRKSSDLGLGGMQREFLQTDCAINQGNSGGPLVNIDGEVVGINVMKVSGADGLNFAVPIDAALKIVDHFERNGRVVRPWLGMKMLDLDDVVVAQLRDGNIDFPDVYHGVLVNMVFPGSPADRAGFRVGDVVVEFGGRAVANIREVVDIMGDKVGEPFKVVVKRGKNAAIQTLVVTPEEVNPEM